MKERVLSLDISTKTGFCLGISDENGFSLESYGTIDKIECPDGTYPATFVDWAYLCYEKIAEQVDNLHPDVLIIEETAANSKSSHSQKILEFVHFLVAKMIRDTKIKSVYFMTGEWRSEAGCKMTKEESLHNKTVKKYKTTNKSDIAYDINGKRIGKKTKKHIAIRRVEELFGMKLKLVQNDLADALLLCYSYHQRRLRGMYG